MEQDQKTQCFVVNKHGILINQDDGFTAKPIIKCEWGAQEINWLRDQLKPVPRTEALKTN